MNVEGNRQGGEGLYQYLPYHDSDIIVFSGLAAFVE